MIILNFRIKEKEKTKEDCILNSIKEKEERIENLKREREEDICEVESFLYSSIQNNLSISLSLELNMYCIFLFFLFKDQYIIE